MLEIKNHRHFILFKPYGYLSQFVYNARLRRNKKLLGALYDFPEGIMSIGRLDEASEGLLLLTTDGKMSELVRSNKVEKEYLVQVDGVITQEAIECLREGVIIGVDGIDYKTKKARVEGLIQEPNLPLRAKKIRDERHGPTSWVLVCIKEGKFRQVRKMTAAVGFPTLRLVRRSIGNININNLQPGDVVEVNEFDV